MNVSNLNLLLSNVNFCQPVLQNSLHMNASGLYNHSDFINVVKNQFQHDMLQNKCKYTNGS